MWKIWNGEENKTPTPEVENTTPTPDEEAAMLEKQAQIDEYQERVRSNNREIEHIDFDKTNIKFIGKKRVGKPTAKAPTQRKDANGEIIDVPTK